MDAFTAQLQRLSSKTVHAVIHNDGDALFQLAKQFAKIVPTKQALAETGAGLLLSDTFVWSLATPNAVSIAVATRQKWKLQVKVSSCHTGFVQRPFGQGGAKTFVSRLDSWDRWLADVDTTPAPVSVRRRLVGFLLRLDFLCYERLECADFADNMPVHASDAALLQRAMARASASSKRRRLTHAAVSQDARVDHTPAPMQSSSSSPWSATEASADRIAATLTPELLSTAEQQWLQTAADLGFNDVLHTRPRVMINTLRRAESKEQARSWLDDRNMLLQMQGKKSALPQVASALQA